MRHLIDKIAEDPVFSCIVAVIFIISMIAFFARVRREERRKNSSGK